MSELVIALFGFTAIMLLPALIMLTGVDAKYRKELNLKHCGRGCASCRINKCFKKDGK